MIQINIPKSKHPSSIIPQESLREIPLLIEQNDNEIFLKKIQLYDELQPLLTSLLFLSEYEVSSKIHQLLEKYRKNKIISTYSYSVETINKKNKWDIKITYDDVDFAWNLIKHDN